MSDMDFTSSTTVSGSSYDSATIENGVSISAVSGSVFSTVTVVNGGKLTLGNQGVVSGGTVEAGGTLVVNSGGIVENVTFDAGAALLTVAKGGSASGLILNVEEDVFGVDSGATVSKGVTQNIEVGGSAANTIIQNSGVQQVYGSSTNVTVIGGGINDQYYGVQSVMNGGVASGTVVTNYGVQVVSSGGVASGTKLETGGSLSLDEAGATVSNVTVGSGASLSANDGGTINGAEIASGGTLAIASGGDGLASLANVTVDSGGTFTLRNAGFSITGLTLQKGATIDLQSFDYSSTVPAVTVDGNTVTVTGTDSDGNAITQAFSLASAVGAISADEFQMVDDGTGSALLTYVACYCLGTLIAVEEGEVPVETLRIGDMVRTASGELRKIRWIGRRSYAPEFVRNSHSLLPIVIKAGAIADNVPRRDLRVSPKHAMYVDGVLVPAGALLNNRTIVQQETAEQIDYFHIELDSHDLLLAEGAPSESYIEDGGRSIFHNAAEFYVLYPETDPQVPVHCAPRIDDGEELLAIWNRLNDRALALEHPRIAGHVEYANGHEISGWFVSQEDTAPFEIEVIADRRIVARQLTAEAKRVATENGEEVRHSFAVSYRTPMEMEKARNVVVRRFRDRAQLYPGVTSATPVEKASEKPRVEVDRQQLHGWIDHVTREYVSGWAWNAAHPWDRAEIDIVVDGECVATISASDHRGDLAAAGMGNGWAGFRYNFPTPLDWRKAHVVEVLFAGTTAPLNGSPARVGVPGNFDEAMRTAIEHAVQDLESPARRKDALSFLQQQADQLRQQQADLDTRREEVIELHRARRQAGPAAANMPVIRRALVIAESMPRIGDNADAVPMLSHMRSLVRLGFDVTFTTVDAAPAPDLEEQLQQEGIRIAGAPVYGSPEEVLRRQAGSFDVVYLRGLSVVSSFAGLARRYMKRAKLIYGARDLQYIRMDRQATVEGRMDLKRAIGRLRTYEMTAALQCDVVLVHSATEATALRSLLPGLNVHITPWDVAGEMVDTPATARSGIAFVGNYNSAPSLDAALVLVRDIMPRVWQKLPHVPCLLAGYGQEHVLHTLATKAGELGGNVQVLGPVDDLRNDLFAKARVSVAPMQFSAGIVAKVVDSFSAGVPCVLTSVAAEGFALPKALSGLVQDDAEAIAEEIIRLYENPDMADDLGQLAHRMIQAKFCVDEVDQCFVRALGLPVANAQNEAKRA
ncbi:Hint domain-containing protein [Acetobacter sp.]|uniref:Hint domain-containing protein n=1 Tax=Acetobacter sp. TaxID=440 RepID=UPI0039EAED01